MSFRFTLILLPFLWANLCHSEVVVRVNRFAGMPDFNRSRTTLWHKDASGIYVKNPNHPMLSENTSCSSMLHLQQQFALAQMIFRGFLNESNARKYIGLLEANFHPSQVTFLQLTNTELPAVPSSLPNAHIVEKVILNDLPPVHSTLAIVAGQRTLPSAQFGTHFLPWQVEAALDPTSELNEISKLLDRNRYRFVWEWGRAAEVKADQLDELLKIAALIQLQEVRSSLFSIEDCWVTVHSLDFLHTKAYRRSFPKGVLGEVNPKTGEAIFLLSLKEIFDFYHPEKISRTLGKLLDLGLTLDQATYANQTFRRFEVSDYDVSKGNVVAANPVVVIDYSDLQQLLFSENMKVLGLDQKKATQVRQVLNSLEAEDFVAEFPSSQDYALTPFARESLADKNSILLTNLDPQEAMLDPNYSEKMIFATLFEKMRMYAEHLQQFRAIDFWNYVLSQEMHFSIFTKDPVIKKQLETMGVPFEYEKVSAATRAKTALELYQAVIQKGMDGLKPEYEIHHRFRFKMEDLFEHATQNSESREYFLSPSFQLVLRRFAIERSYMTITGF